MANRFFVPGQTDWGATAAWSATRSGASGAAVPVTDDDAHLLDGSDAITQNLSQGSVDLLTLTISKTGAIGQPGTPLTIATRNLYFSSSATAIIAAGTNGIDAATVQQTGPNGLVMAGGTWGSVTAGPGSYLVAESGTTISTRIISDRGRVKINAGVTVSGTVAIHNGILICESSIPTLYVGQGATAVLIGTAAISTRVIVSGTYVHRSGGTIAEITTLGGTATTATQLPEALAITQAKPTAFTVAASYEIGGRLFRGEPVPITFTAARIAAGSTE